MHEESEEERTSESEVENSDGEDMFEITAGRNANKVYATLEIGKEKRMFQCRFLLDSGSNTNCCQLSQLKEQGLERRIKAESASKCKAYGGQKIRSIGKIKLTVKNPINGAVYLNETFTVFDSPACIPLLSCKFVQKAGMMKFCYDNFDSDVVYQVSSQLQEEAVQKIKNANI